jgi:oligopeptide transport system permease protein
MTGINLASPHAEALSGADSVSGRSLWQDAWRRLRANRAAVVSLIVLAAIAFASFVGPYLLPWSYDELDWEHVEALPPDFALGHYFGTDSVGRDLLARTLMGGRVSLMVGVLATAVALLIGVTVGAVAGFVGGRTDQFLMRFVDLMYSVPLTFFVIILMVVFGRNFILMFLAIGAVEWLTMARIVRGQTLSIKQKEFIEAARAAGVGPSGIITRHVIPNVVGPVVVYVTLTVPTVILMESFLSFLGLGIQEPLTSWGVLISDGADQMETAPWMLLFPALFMAVTLFCFNFVGDGLRDAMDPKDR